jgi:predicted dinucleotide-binding enzyme
MTTAIIGTGGLGSDIARLLVSGGEDVRLSNADTAAARALATQIGPPAVVAVDNRDALDGADGVVFALRFGVLKGVIDEVAEALIDKVVVVPSNPVGLDASGNVERLLLQGQSSGEVVSGWVPAGLTWLWPSGRCRAISLSPRPTVRRTGRSCFTPPTTIKPARRSNG